MLAKLKEIFKEKCKKFHSVTVHSVTQKIAMDGHSGHPGVLCAHAVAIWGVPFDNWIVYFQNNIFYIYYIVHTLTNLSILWPHPPRYYHVDSVTFK